MKGSAKSDAFLNIVQRPAEICSNGWPSGDMLKRMAPVDSAHQIGLGTLLIDILTVDEGVSQIGRVFEYSATPSGDMLKRMAQRRYAQTDGTSGFNASNRSKIGRAH